MLPTRRSERWLVPAGLAGLTIFFYWKVLFTNRVMFPWDAADFFYPYLSFVHEELRHLRMPFWDPYVMAGYPIIGDPEAQIFYPVNWLLLLLYPFAPLPYRLVEIQLILHFFLAGLFMFYLAKSFVRSTSAALLAAVLFEFSGAMVAHTQHLASINSMTWYPLIFLLARRGLLEGNRYLTLAAGGFFGVQVLAGHLQHPVYLGLLLLLYFAYEACLGPWRRRLWPRWIYSLAIIAAVGGALALVQLLPSAELGSLSVRSYITSWDVTQGNEPRYLLTLFLPNFFGGLNGVPQWYPYDISFNYVFLTVPGCLLALLGLIETLRRRNFFWLGLILLCVELSFGTNGRLGPLVYHVPLLNLFRNVATFFDLANFALCLMAGIGAESLFSKSLTPVMRKYLPLGLTAILFSATLAGLALRLGEKIHGWYAMLAVLALLSIVVTGLLRQRLSGSVARPALFGLIVWQITMYSMNQPFNWTLEDPRHFISRDVALGRRDLLRFLRADGSADFRVAAIAEHALSANGWNVWRIPAIYGWNPVILRRYETYIKGFTHTGDYALPYGGPDHNLNSPMFDLLGVKYLVMGDPDLEKKLGLNQSEKFKLKFTDQGWWTTFENRDYLSRAWFYPRAYVVPDEQTAVALMGSPWFDGRRALIFEAADVPPEHAAMVEPLPTISLAPQDANSLSSGQVLRDRYCSTPRPIITGWGGHPDDLLQFQIQEPVQPGRYLLLLHYTAGYPAPPVLEAELGNENSKQRSEPVTLPRTAEWACKKSRSAELGVFELGPGASRLRVTSRGASEVQIYALWLVRLPGEQPSEAGSFSFSDFEMTPNRIAFRSRQDRDGFILLNEMFYPGWKAQIDGQPAPILRGDSIFRVLYAPAGSHYIEMRFRPRHFTLGAAVSVATAGGLLLGFGLRGRSRARSGQPEPGSNSQGIPLAQT